MTAPISAERLDELLPCPFCDGTAVVIGYGPYLVSCNECDVSLGPLFVVKPAFAVAAWNRRQSLSTARAEGFAEAREMAMRIAVTVGPEHYAKTHPGFTRHPSEVEVFIASSIRSLTPTGGKL